MGAEIPRRNAESVERAVRAQGADVANKCYGETMEEVQLGWMSEPVPLSAVDASGPLVPRFAIGGKGGPQAKKIRLINLG